jgi:hypothetical protein
VGGRSSLAAAVIGGVLLVAPRGPAQAQTGAECSSLAEDGQALRDEGHYQAALDKLVQCASSSCPVVVRRDCLGWIEQIDKLVPSVIVQVTDARGHDVIGVRVTLDGKLVRQRLDGREIVLDPGEHRFLFEVAGAPPQEVSFLALQGQRNRILKFQFTAPLTTEGEADAGRGGLPEGSESGEKNGETDYRNLVGYGLLGLGALGIGTFAVLELVAQGEYRTLRDGCGVDRSCSDSQLSPTRVKFDVAKIALAAGVVSAVAGGVVLLLPRNRRTALTARPTVGGASVDWRLSF